MALDENLIRWSRTIKLVSLELAEAVDAWRLFPRVFVTTFGLFAAHIGYWFTALEKPTAEQSAFVSIVWGAMAVLLNFYMQSGRKWGEAPQVKLSLEPPSAQVPSVAGK